jgi:3-hydroxybutyryl-CoA dehydrogenase
MKKNSKTSKTRTMRAARANVQRAHVSIIGDTPLVEEYAELCAAKGYSVTVRWNAPPKERPTFSSKSIQRSNAVSPQTSVVLELTNSDREMKRKTLQQLDRLLPPTTPFLSSSVVVSATEQSTWLNYKHRLIGFGALPSFSQHPIVEVAPTVFTPKESLDVVQRFFQSLGKEIEVIQDRVGMVLPRILCQIINEAAFAVQEDVATPQDIDTAMRLGTNYPRGPIEWGDRIGYSHVYHVLRALQTEMQEDRYRISPLLAMLAQTGKWWKKE